jgi:site-specific DNA-methyltransferase (adenine-specific)
MRKPKLGKIYQGDSIETMRKWPDRFFDHCITDPPYNMSKKKGLGWAFSSHITMEEKWDIFSKDEYLQFTIEWLSEVCRLVKENGNIFIFGSYHNIYTIGFVLQELNRRIINSIIHCKTNPQPNITARMLTESTEQIIWACNNTNKKAKHWTFNYWLAKEIGGGKQLKNYWILPYTPKIEKQFGKQPTQKPESIIDRIIRIATVEGELILDCFAGSGTTGVVAERLGRQWVMIEKEKSYINIAQKRLKSQRIEGYPLKLSAPLKRK